MRLVAQADGDVPAADDWLSPSERRELAGFTRPKRRHDWRLRRWTAKQAISLAAPDVTLTRITVAHTDDGAPLPQVDGRPAPLALSVSDSQGWAVAAIGPSGGRIGCDVEFVERRSDAFVHDFLTDEEQRVVAVSPSGASETANVMWSAKESALKALGVGLDRDTRTLQVDLLDAGERDGWKALLVTVRDEQMALDGWWHRVESHVVTVVADLASEAPAFAMFSAPG